MSDNKYEYVVINLKVIAQLPRNRRLRTTSKGYFTLEDNHLLVPIIRKIYGEGRDKLKRDIKNLIMEVQTQTRNLLKRYTELTTTEGGGNVINGNANGATSSDDVDEKRMVTEQLASIHRELKRSVNGFENLMSTYESDVLMVGMLEHVIETVMSLMNEIRQTLPDIEEIISPVMLVEK